MNLTQYPLSGQVQTTRYGRNAIGIPRLNDGAGYERIDIYTSNSEGKPTPERRFALNKEDYSPMFTGGYIADETGAYRFGCSCCFLGFSHTVALHNTGKESAK